MNRAFILLGSNIDKEKNLVAAVRMLRENCRVLAISPVYETVPVGLREQANFLNVAVLAASEFGPAEFKQQVLSPIEQALKRVRKEDKNAPRTIDADLILFSDASNRWDERHVPDPDLLRFPHVAAPIAALAPDEHHPESGEFLQNIAERLLQWEMKENEGVSPLWPRPDMDLLLSAGSD